MAYSQLLNRVHAGSALSTSVATIFTFNGSLQAGGAILNGITFVNTGATKRHVTAHLIANGGSASATTEVIETDVPPNETVIVIPPKPWYENSSAFVQVKQDVGTDVTARVHAQELT